MAPSPAGRRPQRSTGRLSGLFRLALAIIVVPLAVVACGTISSSAPPATPTDFPGLAGRLNAVRIGVDDYVSGDAGCTDPDLVPASISFYASGLDQASPVKLYLYVFRNRDAFGRHRDQIGPCAATFITDPETFEQVEQSPYVLVGQGPWAPVFEAALRRVLAEAAGTGG